MKTKWYDNKIIVFALLIFFLPAGLFGLWKSSKFERTGKIAWSVVGVLVLLVWSHNQQPAIEPWAAKQSGLAAAHSSAPAVSQKNPEVYDKAAASELPVTYSEFEENFNSFGNSFTPAMQLSPGKFSPKNKGDKFSARQAWISENIGLVATEADSGRMVSVVMLGTTDGTINSGLDIIMAMGAIMSGVDKSITSEQRGRILKGLGIIDGSVLKRDKSISMVMRGIKYSAEFAPNVGLSFAAEKNI